MKMRIIVKCNKCGNPTATDIDPASMMGSIKKTMTEAALEQRRKAVRSRWDKKKSVDILKALPQKKENLSQSKKERSRK